MSTTKKHMISVIIPVYNVQPYLVTCLDSVLKQTFSNFECICIDDGSPDECGTILDFYAQKDSRIRVIHQKNQGLSMARNAGLDIAKGDYIYFLDSDDYIHPQTLEILYTLIQKYDTDIVSYTFSKVYNTRQVVSAPIKIEDIHTYVSSNPLQTYMTKKIVKTGVVFKLCKRDVIGSLRFIPNITSEDVPFTTMLFAKAKSLLVTDAPLYYYYINPKSFMHSPCSEQRIFSYITGMKAIHEYITQHCPAMLPSVQKHILNKHVKMMLNQAIRKQKNKQTQKTLFKTMQQELIPLYKQGILSYAGLSLHHRVAIWLLYHFANANISCCFMRYTIWR